MKKKVLNKIKKYVGKAIADYSLIENKDRILVGLSGGKDSWTLLKILMILKERAPIHFDLKAIHVRPEKEQIDLSEMISKCAEIGVELTILPTNIKEIIKENKIKKSYCSFCARLRRGFLYTFAKENNFTKIALGHHREDFNETLLMNMFYSGQIKSMAAKLISDDKRNTVIRPLVYVPEEFIKEYSRYENFPILNENCKYEEINQRAYFKKLLKKIEKDIPELQNSLLASQRRIVKSHLLQFID